MSIEFQAGAWALLALIALIVEITHRTFYLVIVSIACALAMGAVLIFHAGVWTQIAVLVVSSVVGIPIAGRFRRRSGILHLADRGQTVKVVSVRDGHLRVLYRGAEWDAIYSGPEPALGQCLKIEDMEGTTLKLTTP